MINSQDLINLFLRAYNEHWGYIWGASGQTWTAEKQKSATRDMTVRYGSKWIGRRVADCSGLFVWAFNQLGAKIYHGSNTIWNKYCSAQGELKNGTRTDGKPLLPGTAVFLVKNGNRHHIGLYIGNGEVIEAKGTAYGVVKSKIAHWDEWGELREIGNRKSEIGNNSYTEVIGVRNLKSGDRGDDVAELQRLLTERGFGCGAADGVFGAKTDAAVRAFQKANNLKIDGIAGANTMAKLRANASAAPTENNCSKPQNISAEQSTQPSTLNPQPSTNISAEQAEAIRQLVRVFRDF